MRTPERARPAAESRANATAGGSGPSAIVVDDEPAIARLIALTLEDAGFHVTRAADGVSALRAIDRSAPDVILLDLRLPDIDGREVYHRIRASGVTAPVVIVSAYGARRARRELGADAAVEKPFDPQSVLNVVEAMLRSRSATRTPPDAAADRD